MGDSIDATDAVDSVELIDGFGKIGSVEDAEWKVHAPLTNLVGVEQNAIV